MIAFLVSARMGATTIEVGSSHLPMVSHPTAVADLIKTAAEVDLATAVMTIEAVPDIPMFRQNTAAFHPRTWQRSHRQR